MKTSTIIIGALISAVLVGGIYAYGSNALGNIPYSGNYCCGYACNYCNNYCNEYCNNSCNNPNYENYTCGCCGCYHHPYHTMCNMCENGCGCGGCPMCHQMNPDYCGHCPCYMNYENSNGNNNYTLSSYNTSVKNLIAYRIEMMEEHMNYLKEHGVNTSFMEERINEIKEYYGLTNITN